MGDGKENGDEEEREKERGSDLCYIRSTSPIPPRFILFVETLRKEGCTWTTTWIGSPKSSSKGSNTRDSSTLLKLYGFCQSQGDHKLFYKQSSVMKFTVLIVYVDGIIVTGDDQEEICRLKSLLAKEFEIKDLGNLRYFLRMEVVRSKECISVT